MIIDLIKLGTSPYDFEYEVAPEAIDLEDEGVRLAKPARIKGTVRPHAAETRVGGTIRAEANLECSRCLEQIEKHFDIEFAAAYVTEEFYTQSKEAELHAADLDVAVFDGEELDLDEIFREQILLSLPEQVFCREDCSGLCQRCGQNLNLEDCGCADEEIDPRWAGLKNLK